MWASVSSISTLSDDNAQADKQPQRRHRYRGKTLLRKPLWRGATAADRYGFSKFAGLYQIYCQLRLPITNLAASSTLPGLPIGCYPRNDTGKNHPLQPNPDLPHGNMPL